MGETKDGAASQPEEAKKKKKEKKEEELSEEDQQLQADMELLVGRTRDPEPSLRRTALEKMVEQIRTSTSSMTSVPKPLKFLRPHYATLKQTYADAADDDTKTLLADVLSLLAMTMAEDGTRESLSYKLLGS